MVKVIIVGAAGRMGRQLIADALVDPQIQVVGAVDAPNAPQIGEDIGSLCGLASTGVTIGSSLEEIVDQGDVVIEFSSPSATVVNVQTTRGRRKAHVIGTTGLKHEERQSVELAARDIPMLFTPNMSVGINLLATILPSLIKAMGEGYDIELIELHHRFKRDAPSGTALMLADIIEHERGKSGTSSRVFGRRGSTPRTDDEIGFHAVRAGGNPGEHRLLFANEGEEIELVHRAHNRQPFSLGALRAARFLIGKPPRLYTMRDVLTHEAEGEDR